MLSKGALFFASPNSLNDLFEMKIDLNVSFKDEEELFNFIKNLLGDASLIEDIKNEMGSKVVDMLNEVDFNYFKQNVNFESTIKSIIVEVAKVRQRDIEELGICCFASSSQNKLMWAHYTDDNSGFCVQFKRDSWLSKCLEVKYLDEYPKINIIDVLNNPKLYLDLIYSKSSEWKYEKEYRAIKEGEGEFEFPKDILSSIIFGYKMANEEKNEIVNMFEGILI